MAIMESKSLELNYEWHILSTIYVSKKNLNNSKMTIKLVNIQLENKNLAKELQYEVPSWNQIYDMLLSQARKICANGYKPDIIVGIARGGLVPLRVLTDLLDVNELATITIEYYVDFGLTRKEPILKQCINTQLIDKKVLLTDDVSDNGKTLQLAKNHLEKRGAKEIKIATIYCKPGNSIKPDFCEKVTNRWIVFPWEAKETIEKIMKKTGDKKANNKNLLKLVEAGFPKQLADELRKED